MAHAIKNVEVFQTQHIVIKPMSFDLNLSMQEATTLMAVLGAVGGSPDGRRGDCDSIAKALQAHCLGYVCGDPDKRGSIIFDK